MGGLLCFRAAGGLLLPQLFIMLLFEKLNGSQDGGFWSISAFSSKSL